VAAAEREWNKEEKCPVPKSELELTKLATIIFDWLDCPDLGQADTMDCPQIDTEDLSISSFDIGHLPSGKVAASNSLAMAQASITGTIDKDAEPSAKTVALGAKSFMPVDIDADDLASVEDSFYNSCSSSSSSSSSFKDPPNSTSTAPPEDIKMELSEAEPDHVVEGVTMLDSTTVPLQSVGDQQQTLGDGTPHSPTTESTNPGSASADLSGWV